jgi:pimeloyl-ACP methyl ester carboxylesterase
MREEKVRINNLNINLKIAGQGPAILILHGWGGSSDSWLEVQNDLVSRGYSVVCPDLPGFGKSDGPPKPWAVDDYVEWTRGFISYMNSRQEFPEFFSLLGHSFGGRIAIKFSVRYPEKIKKLVLCDAAGIKFEPDIKTKTVLAAAKIGKALFSLRIFAIIREWARDLFYLVLRNKDYVKARGVMRETMKLVLNEDLLPELPKISLRTLIVWGDEDELVPLKCAQVFKEKIAGSEFVVLEGVGHSPHLEKPLELAKIIDSFLK